MARVSAQSGLSRALFLFVGIQYEKTHRRLIADLGGLANRWPLYTTFFGIFMLASIGLPGLNGFVGEFLVLLGTFEFSGGPLGGLFWGPLAAIGVILAAVYLLWMFQRVMYGPVRDAYKGLPDMSRLEAPRSPAPVSDGRARSLPRSGDRVIEPASRVRLARSWLSLPQVTDL